MRLSRLFAAGLAGLVLPAADAPLALPREAVVLVVAGWCAPCRGEIARLASIAQAARPRTVLVAALDDQPSTRTMLAGVPAAHRWQLGRADRDRLGTAVFARSAGLPYAFATDARGARCADFSGGLDAPRTRALVARCDP
jgi:hypothetical protein